MRTVKGRYRQCVLLDRSTGSTGNGRTCNIAQPVFYADDAVISVNDPVHMQTCLDNIATWCKVNSLTVNEKKTQWMVYNNLFNADPIFKMNDVTLERCYKFQYLGVTLDPELNFIEHRKLATSNIRHKVNELGKVRTHVDNNTALTIYKSMVIPSFDYGDFIWDRGKIGENKELQYLQNKGLRTVYKVKLEENPLMNTMQLHDTSKCLYLDHRRDMHLLFYAFTLSKADDLKDQRNIPTRRHLGNRLRAIRSLKPIVVRSALYRAIDRWNELKPMYTTIETLWEFKKAIKRDYPNCFMLA